MRCPWPSKDELLINYHDEEWGVPVHDDRKHFEFLVLDAFQAGLSWSIILKKRESFRNAFDDFEPEKIASYSDRKVKALIHDASIIRNRLKIMSTISNARLFLAVQEEFGSFDNFVWRFVDGKTKQNRWKSLGQLPTSTNQSDSMSEALKERGFKFVGSTICYAYMQAAGLVNDHLVSCYRYKELGGL
jgi:DNA-3-methyladenine glycosylase I